jgi:hypothetical protein
MRRMFAMALLTLVVLTVPALAAGQVAASPAQPGQPVQTPVPTPTPTPQVQGLSDEELDLQTVLSEPDFTLGVLPTTLRLPKHKMAFRITHRFTYKINGQSAGEFFENFFGFDSSATSGFELRWGVANGTQLLVHRTGSRNIQFLAQHQLQAQRENGRFSADVLMAVEGQDNFREEHSIVVGGVASHQFSDQGAVYVHPFGVFNATPEVPSSDRNTFVLGLGARFLVFRSRSTYAVAEFAPRIAGYDGGASLILIGLEKRIGGHSFQINLSNGFGTTLTQVGHGGPLIADAVAPGSTDPPGRSRHWHLGFNLTRKFY